jgi:hypothetical protein
VIKVFLQRLGLRNGSIWIGDGATGIPDPRTLSGMGLDPSCPILAVGIGQRCQKPHPRPIPTHSFTLDERLVDEVEKPERHTVASLAGRKVGAMGLGRNWGRGRLHVYTYLLMQSRTCSISSIRPCVPAQASVRSRIYWSLEA